MGEREHEQGGDDASRDYQCISAGWWLGCSRVSTGCILGTAQIAMLEA
jgi:hypothetical protein